MTEPLAPPAAADPEPSRARVALRQLAAAGPGRSGLALLALLIVVSLYVVATYPRDFGPARWSSPAVWADHPKAVPPAWTNLLPGPRRAAHAVLDAREPDEVAAAGAGRVEVHRLGLRWSADEPPSFVSFSLTDVQFVQRPPSVAVSLLRPDGAQVDLWRHVVRGPRPDEAGPFHRHGDASLRVVLSSSAEAVDGAAALLEREHGLAAPRDWLSEHVALVLFGDVRPDGQIEPLHGDYEIQVRVTLADPEDAVGGLRAVVGGAVFGVMGTDALGRDLFEGLLFGLPIALLIGIATSALSTVLGAGLGLVSGYAGGRTDMAIQRAADVVANIPLLPLLIFLVFVLGSRLWLILGVLVAFSWPGLTIMVRSMVLQLRFGPEVEAARALGASRSRIVLRHVLPHLAPFVLAQLIFFAPSAILAEAGLSFLGLGDPSLPTWGQILESGFRTGAVFLGYWWWVVPPGLLIVVTALTFMLLALGAEPAVNPRLRRSWR